KEAEQEFRQAIRLNPNLFEAHYFFGRSLLQQGKAEAAAASFDEASRIRPDDYQTPTFHAMAFDSLGRKEETREMTRHSIALIERHLELNPDDSRALSLGGAMMCQSENPAERAQALEFANRALVIDPEDSGMLYNLGCLYARLGETEHALSCLEQAVHFGFGLKEWVENDPDLSSVRTEPRFIALLASF
ncbi:MAG TPA: tetratricopeptide repeat protein, partial [Gemmatimonadaceae bacterium]|nr:tetratricopeptide repeat protein [Gemmatimonadaceae bacterium]